MTTATPLARLTPSQRRVLRVLHDCGWLYKQASQQLRMPETTLRTTVHRAVTRAGVSQRADLAYWMGVEDGRGVAPRVTLADTSAAQAGTVGGHERRSA